MARRGQGPAHQPYGQGYGPHGYGPPGQPGYGAPGYGQPHPGPPAPPPRRGRLKPILGWTGVVAGGIISTVLATMIVDAVTNKDDKKPAAATAPGGEPAGPALPEGWTAPKGPPVVNGPKFNAKADPLTWPAACDMITDVEIKNAIPEATPRRRTGQKYDGSARGTDRPIRDVGCTIEVALPNLTTASQPATIKVKIVAIGDPEQVKQAFVKAKADDGGNSANLRLYEDLENRLGVDSAYRTSSTLHLLEGGYWIELSLQASIKDTQGQMLMDPAWLKETGPALVSVLNVKMQND